MLLLLLHKLLEFDGWVDRAALEEQLVRVALDVAESTSAYAGVEPPGVGGAHALARACHSLGLVKAQGEPGREVWVDRPRVRALLGLVENWDQVELDRASRYFYQHSALKPGDGALAIARANDLIEKYDGDGTKPLEEPAALVKRLEAQRETLKLDGHALTKTLELLRVVPGVIDSLDSECGLEHGPLDVTASELLVELTLRLLKALELLDAALGEGRRWCIEYRTKEEAIWRESRTTALLSAEGNVATLPIREVEALLESDAWQWRVAVELPSGQTPTIKVRGKAP